MSAVRTGRSDPHDTAGRPATPVPDGTLASFLRTLVDLPDPDTVAHAIATGVLARLDPWLTGVALAAPGSSRLVFEGLAGPGGPLPKEQRAISLDVDVPATVAFRTGDVVILPLPEAARRFPLVAPYLVGRRDAGSIETAMLPLRFRGGVVGVLGLEYRGSLGTGWHLRTSLEAVLAATGMWAALWLGLGRPDHRASGTTSSRGVTVSERQRRIVAMVREGKTNAQIGKSLGYSPNTIKAELATLSRLLDAHGRRDIADRAARAGF